MSRKIMDCRDVPDSNCTLAISGEEDEVLKAGLQHAVSEHGMKDSPETRAQLKRGLKDEYEDDYSGKSKKDDSWNEATFR